MYHFVRNQDVADGRRNQKRGRAGEEGEDEDDEEGQRTPKAARVVTALLAEWRPREQRVAVGVGVAWRRNGDDSSTSVLYCTSRPRGAVGSGPAAVGSDAVSVVCDVSNLQNEAPMSDREAHNEGPVESCVLRRTSSAHAGGPPGGQLT